MNDVIVRSPARALWCLRLRAALFAGLLFATGTHAAPDPCVGQAHCQNLGNFTATVIKVNVTRQDAVTAYQGVRSTVRLTNTGAAPLVLGYRDHSSVVSDNNGLAYRWSSKATGIGVVSRGSADPQFRLAPGVSRDASVEGVVQYSRRRPVAGNVFSRDITLVELSLVGDRQVREARDHVLNFAGLTATSGYGAGAAAARAPTAAPGSNAVVTSGGTAAPPSASTVPPAAGGPTAGCDGAGACQATGPLVARVVRVNVTRSGSVTAYQGVRTTVRFTNVSGEPLILGYKNGSGAVSDETGQAYRWSSKAHGMGVVGGGAADPQFRLAPGESREAAFESTLQYNVRHGQPGRTFTHDLTIVQLQVVGPSQVRTLHEYAISFSNLSAGSSAGGPAAAAALPGVAPDALEAVNKVVDLFKGLKR
jgi:hypothetical protein